MKKKLIEVALPLEAINKESAREKSIRHGHPSTLHLWWARRPLAACRAVLFASLVDDPGSRPDLFPTEEEQNVERQRLFDLLSELVKWENSNNEGLLKQAREAIWRSAGPEGPPPVYDPFCGGGSIPLEAQRLGLEAHGSDLNPVAVLITKALIEIPPQFAGQPPLNPEWKTKPTKPGMWKGAAGLAEDVRYYGNWMRDRARERIGHLYPPVKLADGSEATVIAWLWARTVRCPNPACGATMPLVSSFVLSTKRGKETWVEPIIEPDTKRISFRIGSGGGKAPDPPKVGRGAKFRCLCCGEVAGDGYTKSQGQAGLMGTRLMAMVAEGVRGRIYVEPTLEHESIAEAAVPAWCPVQDLPCNPRWFAPPAFGMRRHRDLFTNRQLVALTTFADLNTEAKGQAVLDGLPPDRADAIATYLAFALSKMADRGSTICTWFTERDSTRNTFARQAIPMTWDFADLNVLLGGTGSFQGAVDWTAESLGAIATQTAGNVFQRDAADHSPVMQPVYSTDPPYYDNIGYADLSDFFYVWLRESLRSIYPELFETILVPKDAELVATPYRFGGDKQLAQRHFEDGFAKAFAAMRTTQHLEYPLTVFYAFKQSESDHAEGSENESATASTGWETMIEGLLRAGFSVNGTWPMRSELTNRMLAKGTNALASSIVLVCRPRPEFAPITVRKDFLASLKRELPPALRALQQGNIAPVDLAQAAIGPGMAVFSRYSKYWRTTVHR